MFTELSYKIITFKNNLLLLSLNLKLLVTESVMENIKNIRKQKGYSHESLQNLTPADVYYGRQNKLLEKR